MCPWQGDHGAPSPPQAIVPTALELTPTPTSQGGASSAWTGSPPGPFLRFSQNCSRRPLRKQIARTAGNRFGSPARPLTGVKGPRPARSEGVRAEGEKVTALFGDRRFCAHARAEPYSYLAQRAGQGDLGMLARRLWSKVLGGRTRGGTGESEPSVRGLLAGTGRRDARPQGCEPAQRAELHPRRPRSPPSSAG